MRKFIALTAATLGIAVSARAQWVVYDPANTVQSVINTAQEIAKFVEMLNNQMQQIQDAHRSTQRVQTLRRLSQPISASLDFHG